MAYVTLKVSVAILALLAGILILLFPKALRLFVGWYLIVIGILGILDNLWS